MISYDTPTESRLINNGPGDTWRYLEIPGVWSVQIISLPVSLEGSVWRNSAKSSKKSSMGYSALPKNKWWQVVTHLWMSFCKAKFVGIAVMISDDSFLKLGVFVYRFTSEWMLNWEDPARSVQLWRVRFLFCRGWEEQQMGFLHGLLCLTIWTNPTISNSWHIFIKNLTSSLVMLLISVFEHLCAFFSCPIFRMHFSARWPEASEATPFEQIQSAFGTIRHYSEQPKGLSAPYFSQGIQALSSEEWCLRIEPVNKDGQYSGACGASAASEMQ